MCVVDEEKWFRYNMMVNKWGFQVNSGFKSHMCESGCHLSVTSVSVYSVYWASALGCVQMNRHSLLHEKCGNMLICSVEMSPIWSCYLQIKSVLFVKSRHKILTRNKCV